VTQQDTDDTKKPPPCPWRHVSAVKEMVGSDRSSDTWWSIASPAKRRLPSTSSRRNRTRHQCEAVLVLALKLVPS
jgi:hypothetical protein